MITLIVLWAAYLGIAAACYGAWRTIVKDKEQEVDVLSAVLGGLITLGVLAGLVLIRTTYLFIDGSYRTGAI